MSNGEILFIIVPSNDEFKNITLESLKRHSEISLLKTYGFYIFEKSNESDWNKYDNIYLNILYICEKYKEYYDYAMLLVGNVFFNMKTLLSLNSILNKIHNLFGNENILVAGTSYSDLNSINISYNQNKPNYYNKVKNLFKEDFRYLIDFDVCFINFYYLRTNVSPFDFINEIDINIKDPHLEINTLFLKYHTCLLKNDFYFKCNLDNVDFKNKTYLNKRISHENLIYKFTPNFFPLPKINNENKNLNSINYYIFNRLYDEYCLIDNSKLSDSLSCYIEENYLKTKFIDILNILIEDKHEED